MPDLSYNPLRPDIDIEKHEEEDMKDPLVVKALEAMEKNKKQNKGGVCSFGCITRADKIQQNMRAICLGTLNYDYENGVFKGCKAFWHYHAGRASEKINKFWIKTLLDPKGPYGDLVSAQPKQSMKQVMEHGYILTDFNFPANYVVNFLTAFRLTQEYPDMAEMIYDLMEDGASFGVAAALGGFVQSYIPATKTFLNAGYARGHYAFSWTGKDYPKNINTSKKIKPSKHLFKDNTRYTPCNVIWGDGANQEPLIQNFIDKFGVKGVPKKKGMFENPIEKNDRNKEWSYDAVLAFCLAYDKGEVE